MKKLTETMTTGAGIAGTDSSDLSTPGAKRLFIDTATRKALELARKIIRKRRKRTRRNNGR